MDGTAATNIPDFHLPASTGRDLSLDSFLDKVPLAIVFLSDLEADRTLLETLDDALSQFGEQRAQLLVVAPVDIQTLQVHVEDHDLNLPALADSSGQMARDFGVLGDSGTPERALLSSPRPKVEWSPDSMTWTRPTWSSNS